MKKRILSICMALVMCLTLLPTAAFAEGDGGSTSETTGVDYLYYDTTSGEMKTGTKTAGEYTTVESNTTTWGTEGTETWYVVPKNTTVTINGTVTLTGDTHLILCDGADLTVNGGITDGGNDNRSLTIYGQSAGSGKLTVTKTEDEGIFLSGSEGVLTVNGGMVEATGTNYGIYAGLTVHGGSISGSGSTCDIFATTFTVTGGTFDSDVDVRGFGRDALTGGTFNKKLTVSVSISGSESYITDLLADSYLYQSTIDMEDGKEEGEFYTASELANVKSLSGVKVVKCQHSIIDTDGTCSSCLKNLAAKRTNGTTTSYYLTLQEAVNEAQDDDIITLLIDLSAPSNQVYCLSKSIVLDLNGNILHGLTVSGKAIKVRDKVGGGQIRTLNTSGSNGMKITDLLETGYGFKDGTGTWYDNRIYSTTQNTVSAVEVKKIPIDSVSITAKPSYPYGEIKLVANVVQQAGVTGDKTYEWTPMETESGNTTSAMADGSDLLLDAGSDYTYRLKVTVDGYSVTSSNNVTFEVVKATPTVKTDLTATVTYGDAVQNTDIQGEMKAGGRSVPGTFKWKDASTYGDATNGTPRTLKATFTPDDEKNYNSVDDLDVSVTVNKAAPAYTAPKANTLTYTGRPQELITSGSSADGTMQYKLDNGTWGTDIPKATNAGEYTVSYRVVGDANHNNSDEASVTVNIAQKQVTPTVTVTESNITYDGTAKTPTVIVNDGETTIAASEYEVAYSDNTIAGTATVTVTDKTGGNYAITEATQTFEIAKAALTGISVEQKGTLTYNGNPQTAKVNTKATAVNNQQVSFTYCTSEDGTYGEMPPHTDAGFYLVYYKASAANHNDATGYFTVTIGQATPTVTDATATVTYGKAVENSDINATANVDGNFAWKNVDSYGDATNGTPKTLQATFTPTDAKNYNSVDVNVRVTVSKADLPESSYPSGLTGKKGNKLSTVTLPDNWSWVSGDTDMNDLGNQTFAANYAGTNNYNKKDNVTLTVNVTAKEIPTINADALTATYGNTEKKIAATATGDGTISYAVKSGSDVLDVDTDTGVLTFKKAGTATVTVSVSETATYAANSKDVTVTVNKAALTVTAKNQSIYVNGTVLDLTNPVKDTHYIVTGLVNGDTLSVSMEYRKDGSAVTPDVTKTGTYDIVITATADTEKYVVTATSGTLTVSTKSSGGGGSNSGTTITVPVSSDHATVDVKAEVKKGNATVEVSDKQIEKVIADHAGEVTIDVSGLKNVESATVPSHVVEKTNEAENTGLTVSLPAGSVTLDETALESVTENANGKDVTVSVVAVSTETLPTVVKEVIGMEPTVLAVVDVNVIISGKKQSSFDGGKVTISVPYTPKTGEDTSKLTVWFIKDDGTIENKGGYYDAKNKCFVFETDHLSQYILVNPNEAVSFVDVPTDAYFADAVKWAAGKGITGGVDATHFMPNNACTRAQIVTFLWRAAGSPEPKATSSFTDVPANAYYAKAVAWAVENGITGGIGNNQFAPDLTCTRAQAAAFLFRYAAANGMEAVTLQELVGGYGDAASVPSYALPAFNWALAHGIVNGYNGNLMPNNDCTRAQIVTMLYRMLGK